MALSSASNGATSAQALRATVPKERVVGLVRDLRGITTATNNKKTYGTQPEQAACTPRLPGGRTTSLSNSQQHRHLEHRRCPGPFAS